MKKIPVDDINATILLVGPYSYEWSYYSYLPIIHYSENLKNPITKYMICIKDCPESLKRGMVAKEDLSLGITLYERQ